MIAKSTSSGLKAMVPLVVLRNKAIKPLLAAAQDLRPSRGASSHSNAHAVHRRSYLWRGRHFFNKAQDATQRDRNPLRTIVEFISKLIQGFENQEAPTTPPRRDIKGEALGFYEAKRGRFDGVAVSELSPTD